MAANTSIEWTDKTWNPVRGCALVSEGCRNCYAMKVAHRFSGVGGPYEGLTEIGPAGPRWTGKVRLMPEALAQPLRWRKPQRIFVNSMSDLFHEDVPDAFIERVFSVMGLAERHTFQVLTKRPDRMLEWFKARRFDVKGAAILQTEIGECHYAMPWPLPNVWLGISAENQATLDARLPILIDTPAAVRFVSAEPLLSGLDIAKHRPGANRLWVIVGGESGAGARPCQVWWIENIVGQCRCADVPVFVKQLGAIPIEREDEWRSRLPVARILTHHTRARSVTPDGYVAWAVSDGKGGEMDEWPESLRVREFPHSVTV